MKNAAASLSYRGKVIMEGDAVSIAVIAKNISGENFDTPSPARLDTHAGYLAYLGAELGVDFLDGAPLVVTIDDCRTERPIALRTAPPAASGPEMTEVAGNGVSGGAD